ncbi:MAG: cytochrome c [Verrucomicrobia bacterium]|nr:cytochrome c [Kiritimatiellia bacterium]MCO6399869.1 cytochrome c [Verrucomicrobiota bacterium]
MRIYFSIFVLGMALAGSGCELRKAMYDQPKLRPLQKSEFFSDERASRTLIEGTVARNQLHEDDHLYNGLVNGEHATTFPFPITREVLLRGQERFNIYCSPCHDRAGMGNGMIVQRGFKHPVSFHDPRLQSSPPGYFYNAIKNGFGQMPSYADQIHVNDRWAIIAYIRALQLSQNATLDDVPESERSSLDTAQIKPGQAAVAAH